MADPDLLSRHGETITDRHMNGQSTRDSVNDVRDTDAESYVSEKGVGVREEDYKKRQVC